VLYFVILVFPATLFIGSVARNVRGPSTARSPSALAPTRIALRGCLSDLEALYQEQNARLWGVPKSVTEGDPVQAWNGWSRGWEARVDDLTDRCHLDVPGAADEAGIRARLAAVRDALLSLHRAYTGQVNRFAGEAASLVRGAEAELARAREAVSAQ
jgi:hypothetical protein